VSVGEVFEVMAQVDHDLTTVKKFDRLLGLIKNLGRYTMPFTNCPGVNKHQKIKQIKLNVTQLIRF
jgi:hypothetical protein